LRIRKAIDRSSPLLLKALTDNQVVEGTFRFYRPSPTGDGTTEQFYTVAIKQGRVTSVRQYLPDTLDPGTVGHPPLEEVTFSFGSISWTFTDGGITHEDNAGKQR
jgi:type VI secretion system secreted protein Hcp